MTVSLKGRFALVCGASRGIGLACAERIAGHGASVLLVARDEERLARVVEGLNRDFGQSHRYLAADLSQLEVAISRIEKALADQPVEILINNTGGPPPGPILEADWDAFLDGMRAHLAVNHMLVKRCLPGMRASGYGRIVNIVSTSVREPLPGLGVSNTVRAAVAAWAKTLAGELGPEGITINNVLPGFTDTDRLRSLIASRAAEQGTSVEKMASSMEASVPMCRFGEAREVAAAAAFLAGPDASYITGTSLAVDGGRTRAL